MLRFLVQSLLRLVYRVELRGFFPQSDRMLIVANHQSFLDAALLALFLPVRPTFLVHTSIAKLWYFQFLLKQVPHLVVDTSSPYALKAAVQLIESGKPLVIFPEGRITVTGSLMKVYDGPAFVAARSNALIVPIHIQGAVYARFFSRMKAHEFPQLLTPKIILTVHSPSRIPMPEAPSGKLRRRLAGEEMRRLLQRMLVEARPRTTLFEAFLNAVQLHGRGRQIVEEPTGQEFTYGLLIKAGMALGRLVGRVSAEGESVGVLMPNVGATLSLLLGMFATRRIPALLNYTAGSEGMQSACRAAKVKTIITSRAFLERARLTPVVERMQGVRLVYLEDLRATLGIGDKLWLILRALPFPRSVMIRAKPSDPAVVLFTSGSEGKPKGVVLSHECLLANIAQIRAILDFVPEDRFLSAMPLFHSFGLTGGFLLPILTGARIFIYPTPLHYRLIPELAYDRDCTVMFATNTFLANYAKRAHPYDFRSVRLVVAGAEKLTEEVRKVYVDRFGVRIIEGYGATECSPVVSANTFMNNKPGTVGELMPGMQYKLETVPGIDNGALLHVAGPNVMLGYWKEDNPAILEPPSSIFGPGWYNTGDVVTLDEDGMIQLRGRVKRFAKVAGEMVSLEVVEKLAETASPATLHAATTIPDAKRGEMIVLYTQDAKLDREQLQRAAQSLGAPELAIPRKVVHLAKMPLLGNGKKDYPAINQLALNGK